jgi:FkbM family methyltransferase
MEPKTTNILGFFVTYFNKEEIKILKQEIFQNEIYKIDLKKKTPLIFDLGSHIGLSVFYFKNKYPNSKIICFEPNPNIFPLLEENISSNQLKNVELYNLGVGKKESNRELFIDASGSGAFSTASFKKNAWNGEQKTIPITVRTVPLSGYITKNVDLIKMDLEGAENEVLKDLEENKKLHYVKNIIMEYHPLKKNGLKKIVNLLEKNEFHIEYFQDGKRLRSSKEDLILVVAKKRIK